MHIDKNRSEGLV